VINPSSPLPKSGEPDLALLSRGLTQKFCYLGQALPVVFNSRQVSSVEMAANQVTLEGQALALAEDKIQL
jgi:hypothetical protein